MLEKKDERSYGAMREELIENLLFYDWSSEGAKMNKTFLILLDAYLGSELCDSADPDARQEIAFHLVILHGAIENLQHLSLLKLQKTA